MTNKIHFLLVALFISLSSFSQKNTENIKDLTKRLLPERFSEFKFAYLSGEKTDKERFEIVSSGKKILIKGTSSTAITSGLNYYLHHYCNASFSWNGDQTILPNPLPKVNGIILKESPYTYRYSSNYCTHSYTMSFWDWKRWEREIDLMAMQGVNVVLSPIGSEEVWQKTLQHFGYSFTDIQKYICGPAYTAWWLMGNLEGEGGPISQSYINARTRLQKKIIARLNALGIKVVLQGFAGLVPTDFATKVPAATVIEQGKWCGYYKRPSVVTGAYADSVAKYWYKESVKLFGTADFYGGDAFHEGGKVPKDLNVSEFATQLQKQMLIANPNATWVLQAWQSNPRKDILKGLQKNKCLILDYSNDVYGFWKSRNGFEGYPWVYGVINNFGGRMGMYARLQKVADDVYKMQHSPIKGNNVGIGIAPEAIIYNQVSYDLLWDLAWDSTKVNTSQWIKKFVDRRYGKAFDKTQQAWQILEATAFNCKSDQEGGSESIINARPSLDVKKVSGWSTTKIYYQNSELIRAWTLMMNSLDELKTKTTFKHDLVDISRQVLANYSLRVYTEMTKAYNDSNKVVFDQKSKLFLDIMLDQDSLLRTREEYLLGKWIADARAMGTSPAEADLFELNARALPTTWCTFADGMLHEYSHHEWAGLTKDYYRERWKLFISSLYNKFEGKPVPKINFFNEFESKWIQKKGNGYNVVAAGKEIEIVTYIYQKYFPLIETK